MTPKPAKEPATRGVIEKTLLDGVKQMDPPVAARFERQAPKGVLERVRDMSTLGWMPMSEGLPLRAAMVDLVGETVAVDMFRRQLLSIADGTVLGPLTAGLVRIFGLDPKAIVKAYPRLWNAMTRNAGTMYGETLGDHEAYLEHRDAPRALDHLAVLDLTNRASLLAMLDYIKREGTVEVQRTPHARFLIRWK